MSITKTDLAPPLDADLALRVLGFARTIAPLDDIPDGEPKETAIAILKAAAAELPTAGSRRVRSQSRNGTSITLADISATFSDEDRATLRHLAGVSMSGAGLPVGSFPVGGEIGRVWPEVYL